MVEEKQKLYLNLLEEIVGACMYRCWRETKVVFKYYIDRFLCRMNFSWRETKVVFKLEWEKVLIHKQLVEEKQKLYLNELLEWCKKTSMGWRETKVVFKFLYIESYIESYTVEEKQKLYLNVNTLKNLLNTQKLKRNKSCI